MAVKEGFVFVDFETTGLDPQSNRIIEMAAIRIGVDNHEVDSFEQLVDSGTNIPPFITELTGIKKEDILRLGVDTKSALVSLISFVGTDILVAFNASFDQSFFEAECKRCGVIAPKQTWYCALEVARNAWPIFRNHKLSSLAKFFDLPNQTHRALDDCRIGAKIFYWAQRSIENNRVIIEIEIENLCVSGLNIDNLYSCNSGDELVLWTRPDFHRINAYAPDSWGGGGLVLSFEKSRNPWLVQHMNEGVVQTLRLEREINGKYAISPVITNNPRSEYEV